MSSPSVPPKPRPAPDAAAAADRQARAYAPPGQAGVLANRILIHARPRGVTRLLPIVDQRRSGIILCGDKPEKGVRRCRNEGFAGILAIDPRGYRDGAATADAPFALPPADDQLFAPSLEQVLDDQRAAGADVALTPTKFFQPGDAASLKAAARTAADLDRDDTIFSVPVSIAWLNSTYISQLVAVLSRVQLPKAIFLGSQLDPLDNVKEAVDNLRRLRIECGHVALFSTDFAAFDFAAHGGFAASIGTGGRLRHIIPPDEDDKSIVPKDQSPSVLFPDLLHFFKGSTLAKRFENAPAPRCPCVPCNSRSIDTFLGRADSAAAHLHNIHIWMDWLSDLFGHALIADRVRWWQGRCEAAVLNHEIYNQQLGLRNAFRPTRALTIWAQRTLTQGTLPAPAR
jgi:hypothetical protein